jgi:signal transduction histidine kinase
VEDWYRIQSALLAAIVCAALAVNVLLSRERNRLLGWFALFNLNLVAWFLTDALVVSEALGVTWGHGAKGVVGGLIPATLVGFFAAFAALEDRAAVLTRRASVGASLLLVASAIAGWPEALEARQSVLFGAVLVAILCSMAIVYRRYRTVQSRVDRARFKVLVIAGAIVLLLSLFEYLPTLQYASVSNILTAIYMFFLFQVITLRRLLDLFEFLGRFVVLAGFAVVLSVIYAALVGWWRHDMGLFLFNTLIASIVVLILFDPLRSFVEDKLNELVFREKYEFTRQTELLREDMQSIISLQALADAILRRLEASRRVTHASVYVLEEDGRAHARLGYLATEPPPRLDAVAARPFLTRLFEEKLLAVENLEAERAQLARQGTVEEQASAQVMDTVLQTVTELHAALVVGFVSGDQVMGFLAIKDERLRAAYSSEEIKAIVQIAAQTTIVIENSRHFDRIRERDRLAALGEMAAGLAHEIRNPLGAIKGAAQLLTGTSSDAERNAYLEVIVEEVNRLNGVVSQFLSYARPMKGQLDPVDVNLVLERTITLLAAENHPCKVELVAAPNLPSIRSDPELLRQVALNLARNAIEAMGDKGGSLTISTQLAWRRPAAQGMGKDRVAFVRTRFVDTGPGMPPEVMARLFIPFYTTKQGGTGLGLAICQRIVRGLGGAIEVSSRVGEGTTFNVYLPVSDASTRTSTAS